MKAYLAKKETKTGHWNEKIDGLQINEEWNALWRQNIVVCE